MKNKDIEKMLAAGKDRILPDESVKSRIADELGYTSSAPALAYAHGGVKTVSNKKRVAIIAAAAAVVMAIVIGIAVPLSLNNGSSPTNPFGNKFLQITDAESFYAYGAASVGALLSGNSDALTSLASVNARGSSVSANAGGASVLNSRATPNANNALTYTAMPSAGANSAATDEAVQTAERYMALVENLLGSGEISETVSVGTNGYEYTMTVSYTDFAGSKIEYTMNYDRTPLGSETEDGETEESYAISGELVIGDSVYPVEGIYETETEEDETGSSMEFKAYTSSDKRSFIAVEHETESETEDGENETETEYVYTVTENGRVVEQTTVGYETENGELELEMTVRANGRTDRLLFTDETEHGERVLSVRADINGESVSFKIFVRGGEYVYVFPDDEK